MPSPDVEAPSKTQTDTKSICARWVQELKIYEKEFRKWEKRAEKVAEIYSAGAKTTSDDEERESTSSRFNIFWSNVNVLQPALYARTPVVQIDRRHKDKDVLGRLASEVWERGTDYEVKAYDFDGMMNECVLDYLIAGRGVARVRYDVETEKVDGIDPMTGQPAELEQLVSEKARCEYLFYKDFRHQLGRTWDDVSWVAFRSYLNRDDLDKRGFPADLPLNHKPKGMDKDEPGGEMFAKAVIWEIWDKATKTVLWLCEGYNDLCDSKPDPLGLSGFFPCPKPIHATRKRGSLVPVPDYDICSDQYKELDSLSTRCKLLLSALKVAGVYDASVGELERLTSENTENKLIPVQNWTFLAEKGGIDGVISWMPIEQIAKVLIQLYDAKDRKLQEIYEVTGLSDIVRGNSNANETATAQQIKGNFATLRLTSRQQEVQRFARDLIALKAEIIAEHYQPDTLRMISGYDQLPDATPMTTPEAPQQTDPNMPPPPAPEPQPTGEFDEIMGILRDDPTRRYRIDVETDSTIAVDEQQEKEKANEYLTAVGNYMQQVLNVAQVAPQMMPYMAETLKFINRKYRAGRSLEMVLDSAIDGWNEQLQQPPPPPPPDPKMIEVQQNGQIEGAKLQIEREKMQAEFNQRAAELEVQRQKDQLDAQIKIAELQAAGHEAQAQEMSEPSEPAAASTPPMTINVSVGGASKRIVLGPVDPLTGVRSGQVVEEAAEPEVTLG